MSDVFYIYGLISDRDHLFYIGSTRRLEKRIKEHKRFFRGVKNLGYVILGSASRKDYARNIERALCIVLGQFNSHLVNRHYYVDMADAHQQGRHADRMAHYCDGTPLPAEDGDDRECQDRPVVPDIRGQ